MFVLLVLLFVVCAWLVRFFRCTLCFVQRAAVYIYDHESGKTRLLFIIFALLHAGKEILHKHEYMFDLNNVLMLSCENKTSHFIFL